MSDSEDGELECRAPPPEVDWDQNRPFLTGHHIWKEDSTAMKSENCGKGDSEQNRFDKHQRGSGLSSRRIGSYAVSIQEFAVIEDLIDAMVGIEGAFVKARTGPDESVVFYVDDSMDPSLQELAERVLPLCESYCTVSRFVEIRSHFKHGLASHALAAAIRSLLQDYQMMIAQLEHQFNLGRLSLQGLWFYCQPMMGAMQVLSLVVHRAFSENLTGASLLNLLQSQASAIAGDSSSHALLMKLLQSASASYLAMLEKWIYEGTINDPYGEFLVEENKNVLKESLTSDYNATYWQNRYILRDDIPDFLKGAKDIILTTGKYLNAVRECGHLAKNPAAEANAVKKTRIAHFATEHTYLERINIAHNFASQELLKVIIQKADLMGRLRSVKHYFLLEKGDFLVHFMDIAREELTKRPALISLEKLQSLLELALRTSVCATDPYHEDLTCSLENSPLAAQLNCVLKKAGQEQDAINPDVVLALGALSESSQPNHLVTGMETFTLDYKVRWPLSLVISRKTLTKYQVIFRHLFHCKHVERQLCLTWQALQATRGLDMVGGAVMRSYFLCQRMLHFVQNFVHYMTFEVLEPNWHVMDTKLQSAKTVDEVIRHHDEFLDRCIRECMLLMRKILSRLEKLKATCVQYVTATQWLVPMITFMDGAGPSGDVGGQSSDRERQRRRRLILSDHARRSADEQSFKTTVGKLEKAFNQQLQEFVAHLSSCSHMEPYLTHLAQKLQGMGQSEISY